MRSDATKTRKHGTKGALRIDYGDPHQPQESITWMWRFLDGGKTAGELCGRALLIIAVERGLEEDGNSALEALVADYVRQAELLDEVPMVLSLL